MIGFLRGRLAGWDEAGVLIDVGGVGYRVQVPASTLERLPVQGGEVTLETSLQVREDSLTLYGFMSGEERGVFELLLGVSGVGPRLALAVLSALGVKGLAAAVATGDVAALARVPGIGKKTAGRLLLELKDSLPSAGVEETPAAGVGAGAGDVFNEAASALQSLGYTGSEALRVVSLVRKRMGSEAPIEEIVRTALQVLGGGEG